MNAAERLITLGINRSIVGKCDLQTDPEARDNLTHDYSIETLSGEALADLIQQRVNFTSVFSRDPECYRLKSPKKYPAGCSGFHRKSELFRQSDLIPIDCDNNDEIPLLDEHGQQVRDAKGNARKTKVKREGEAYFSIDRLLDDPFVKQYALIVYTTPSHTEDHHKLRIVFLLPQNITDRAAFERLLRLFIWRFRSDPACSDAARFFYGCGEGGQVFYIGNTLTDEAIEQVEAEHAAAYPPIERAEVKHGRVISISPEAREDRKRFHAERAIATAQRLISESCGPSYGASGKIAGNRHHARCRAAYLIGGYIAGGIVDYSEGRAALESAVSRNTDNYSAAMQTIDDCLRAGMSEPIIFEELEAERLAYPKARQPELTKDERRERANVLRSGGRQTTETQPGIVEREISESTDMLNFILARAKVPANERATVLALVGACQEKARPGEEGEWFELNDFELGLRLRCDSEDKPDEFMSKEERQSFADRERLTTGQWRARYETRRAARIQKHAQRRRKSLVEWQTEHGYQFVICAPGGKKGDEHFPSRYRVPLLVEAAEALTQAREKRSYNIKHPEKALRAEAKLALQRLEGTSPIVERFRRKGRQPKNVIDSNHRLILTKFQRNLELETRIDNDPVEYYESLISDLTKIMTGHGFAVSSSPFVHIHEREYGQKNSDESGPQIDQFEVDKSVHLDETDNPLSNQTLTAKSSKNNLQNENAQVPDYQQLDEEALDALFEDEKRASVAAFNSRAVLQELADLGYDKVARDRMKPEEAIQRRAYAATGD